MYLGNFNEVHKALRKYYGSKEQIRYGLERMKALMDYLGNPQNNLKVIHVAGTSGKTSTAYYASAMLMQAGFKVGLTVSPHVDELNERVQLNLVPLAEGVFSNSLGEFLKLVEQSGINPSYFELMISFAFYEFAKQKVDYAVVEVGLGGIDDATNVIARADKVGIITDIGLDHVEVLGNTLSQIATKKAGIAQQGNEVFMYRQSPPIVNAVSKVAKEKNAKLHVESFKELADINDLPVFQQRNFGLALHAINFILNRDGYVELSIEHIKKAAHTHIPARMEIVRLQNNILIIDGSHNAQKISQLINGIHKKFGIQQFIALVAFVSGPDSRWQQALDELLPNISELIVTSFIADQDTPKTSVVTEIIKKYCEQKRFTNVIIENEPANAYQKLVNLPANPKLIVGSFYLLNHIRPLILRS